MLGYRYHDNRTATFHWGSVTRGWGIALELCHFEEWWSLHFQPFYGSFYIHLWPSVTDPHNDMRATWGAAWYWSEPDLRKTLIFKWGTRSYFIHLPWAWKWVRNSWLLDDGAWFTRTKTLNRGGWLPPENRWRETHPYHYALRNGERQVVMATIGVGEAEWRWRALMWLPWPRLIRRSIDVHFDSEVGEGTGSYKGGTIGCRYDLRPGETPYDCLQRMERERVFS